MEKSKKAPANSSRESKKTTEAPKQPSGKKKLKPLKEVARLAMESNLKTLRRANKIKTP